MLFSLYSVEMEDLFPLEPTWMLAVAASVLALVMLRRLIKPLHFQNTAFITVVLMLGQAFIEWLVVVRICKTDLPDPRWRYYAGAALLWMAISLTARRFAKLIARPWRKERVHWLWVIFLSGLGAGAFQFFWPLLEAGIFYEAEAPGHGWNPRRLHHGRARHPVPVVRAQARPQGQGFFRASG